MLTALSQRTAITIIGVTFFVFGFVTWLNGPLISFVKLAFTLSDVEAFLVPLVFYMSYLVFALPSAAVLRRTGMKRGMAMGLLIMAGGTAMFGQFVAMRTFPGALAGLFVIGGGLAMLQTAVNPYISIIGPIEGAAQRIAIMGICNKTAGMIAPIVFGVLIMHGVNDLSATVAGSTGAKRDALLQEFASRIHGPYLLMAVALGLLAFGILRSPLPELSGGTGAAARSERRGLSRFPHLWLGVVCLFLYMGAEVMAGDAIGIYGQAFGLPFEQTSYFTSLTLAAMLVGYVSGLALIPRIVSQERYLAFSATVGLLATLGAFLTRDYVSVAFVASLGFANAMMWPAIFPLSIRGLGRHMEAGSALLVMAICGGAIVPQLFALLKQHIDFQLAFLVLMGPSYLYILYFALRGHRAAVDVPVADRATEAVAA
jgi:glucose/galactose transporter